MKEPEGGGAALLPRYVLVTPARNEAAYIELTIRSVISQEILPARWVIVSDGSTDGTDDIVREYANDYPWIELVRMPERAERHFAAKVAAFNAGYERVKDVSFEIIGNIDADISFDAGFFPFLLEKFRLDPSLGVAGSLCVEEGTEAYDFEVTNIEDVSGACQLFRHACFKDIGGYLPIKGGGIDSVAVYTARMKGWQTRTFTERSFLHHRKRGGAEGARYAQFFKGGRRDYNLGGHPLWHTFRSVYQLKNRPYVLGGVLLWWGYMWEFVRRSPRPISDELVQFLQNEQLRRLRVILAKKKF